MITGRQAQVSACFSTAGGYASGTRRDLDEAAAVQELRAVSTDPDVLAEAAAAYLAPAVEPPYPYADAATALLVLAGADEEAIRRHVTTRRRRRSGGLAFGQP